mmetsp:Transcript_11553/g.34576  ORF Transcript_11553/g.34576 Transcript_11553/m.34576 type:complete len:227 (+) Transcript_11553:78-758(+)
MAEEVQLNFEDAVLYGRDLGLLSPPEWLNDACVHLGFRVIASEVGDERVLLMDPSVYSYMLLQCDEADEFAELRTSLRLEQRALVLIPVNDADSFDVVARGTHWSLLAYWSADDAYEHYDSMPTSAHARVAAPRAVAKFNRARGGEARALRRVEIPAQTTSYDCGAHVLAVADSLARSLDRRAEDRSVSHVTPAYVADFRRRLRDKAYALSEDYLRAKLHSKDSDK